MCRSHFFIKTFVGTPLPGCPNVGFYIHIVGNGLGAVPLASPIYGGGGRAKRGRRGDCRFPAGNKKAAHKRVQQKEKLLLSQELCVGITYFHGPSPGNYRRRK